MKKYASLLLEDPYIQIMQQYYVELVMVRAKPQTKFEQWLGFFS